MNRIVEYIKKDMREFAWQISVILDDFGATPEARNRATLALPNLKEAYAELAVLRERIQLLEETLRTAGIPLP
jgi:hypothetical protein